MGKDSKIEWTHHTFNCWRGCTKVSAGCAHCYAEKMSHRNPKVLGIWGDQGTRVVASEAAWREPLKWDREAAKAGRRQRVFCASLADVFEDRDDVRLARLRLLGLIEQTPNLAWLLLTKRPENIAGHLKHARQDGGLFPEVNEWPRLAGAMIDDWVYGKPPANVWLGTSVEDRKHGLPRIDYLRRVPAAIRFLSVEPLLEDLGTIDLTGISWVIVGGESGPKARPMHPDWARSLRDQCQAAGVPFHFKQWGEWLPVSQPTDADEVVWAGNTYFPRGRWLEPDGSDKHRTWDAVVVDRVGKKAAGRTLDGREWNEFPNATPASEARA